MVDTVSDHGNTRSQTFRYPLFGKRATGRDYTYRLSYTAFQAGELVCFIHNGNLPDSSNILLTFP